ncbi:MAG: asparagine synthase (glutamine-hydrolyzing) [Phycisphaerae bacterium]|nr:asparagine synthase (glutamine-hydrolyzing) [Phycisphaerae bacterium]
MCGIAGIFNLSGSPADPEVLRKMADVIAHRGPDGEGFHVEGMIGLGHRRLAIIDLSEAGKQPMLTADEQLALVYNGEIYNFQELRAELESRGHQFRSRTDSEVVLQAWQEWGPECVHRFNGMFAFAIWDKRNQSLYLVRDRYGIKPLYWARWGSTFLFGSEQKAILQHPDARREVDPEAMLEYFTFQNIFTDRTLLKNVRLLPPGTIARISPGSDKDPELTRYWDYDFREPENPVDPREYREELDRLIKQAVSRQLVSDVELGSYLSGGMDSGTLTALASRELPYIKTFTCGFDLSSASGIEMSFDERVKAEAMSAVYKTEHYEMVLKAGDMERAMPTLAYHLEEPRVGQSYPNYYASKLASKFVKVVLSGAGGDELFGGYPWRYYRAVRCDGFEDYIDQYYVYWQRLIDNTNIKKVFAPIWSQVDHVWTRDIFRDVFEQRDIELERPEDFINHSLYFEAKTFLHGLLVVEDKLSMSHGLESRVPFLDNDLVDFAMSCPVGLKLNNLDSVLKFDENTTGNKTVAYFQKTNDGKQILRDVMRSYIPEHIVDAVKQGFSAPDGSWFKGESIDYVRNTLMEGDPFIYQFMDRDSVTELVDDHLQGHQNRRLFIWSLLNVEQWMAQTLV